jgi:glucose-1-phosphate cytidylyltransferase
MKVIILAGGLGTRISEETVDKPKPMVLIGEKPIIWHVMNIYASQGHTDFVIATGYKSEVIENWVSKNTFSDWNIETIFTGLDTQTGGRIRKCLNQIDEPRVMVTYGDGLGSVNISKLIENHERMGKLASVTAVRPPARFGVLESVDGIVTHFGEKNQADAGWINGGFFVLEKEVTNFVESDDHPFEFHALPKLVASRELTSYQHKGFWQPMDTLREKHELTKFAEESNPPWLRIE